MELQFNIGASADTKKWFSLALKAGVFSLDHRADNYVGDYQFVRQTGNNVMFKHQFVPGKYINTRADRLITNDDLAD